MQLARAATALLTGAEGGEFRKRIVADEESQQPGALRGCRRMPNSRRLAVGRIAGSLKVQPERCSDNCIDQRYRKRRFMVLLVGIDGSHKLR